MVLIVCDCHHPFQDERYGYGRRLHNDSRKDGNLKGWRCTVCGNMKPPAAHDDPKADRAPKKAKQKA